MAMSGCGLRKELVTFEPLRMVNPKEEVQGDDTFQLSNLDHLTDHYNAVALFFDRKRYPSDVSNANFIGSSSDDNDADIDDPACKLLNALEELLAHYPAAAGRLHFNEITKRYEVKYKPESSGAVDNKDSTPYGVPFVVGRADTTLSMLGDVTVPHPSLDILYPDIPKRHHKDYPPSPLLLIQVTTFTCGSFTLASTGNHRLFDGYTAAIFMTNLCSIAKGVGLASSMDLTNRREIFKPSVLLSPKSCMHPYILSREQAGETDTPTSLTYGNATRFSISAVALEILRLRASPNAKAEKCSRYQALSALLWKTVAKCYARSGALPSQELPLRFPMNLRGRELPTMSGEYMGNALSMCIVRASVQELCESSLVYVVQKITSSMVKGVHMQEHVQSTIDYIESLLQNGRVPYFDHVFLGINSFVSLSFYNADCGWGQPIYCGRPSRQLDRRIIILDDPHLKCWNVLVVLKSPEEYNIFQEEITTICS